MIRTAKLPGGASGGVLDFGAQDGRRARAFVAIAVLASIAIATIIAVPKPRTALLVLLALVTVSPIAVRAAERRFDIFEPIVPLSAVLFVMYVLRAAVMILSGQFTFRVYDTTAGFQKALLVALIGTATLYGGYAIGGVTRRSRSLHATSFPLYPARVGMRAGAGLIGLSLVLFGIYILRVGGPAAALPLLTGRTTDQTARNAASAYFYFGPFLAIPGALLLWEASRRTSAVWPRYVAVGAVAEVLAVTVPRGDRVWLSELLFSVTIYYYLSRARRPRIFRVIVAALVFVILTQILLNTRNAASRGQSGHTVSSVVSAPGGDLRDFVLGPDDSMFAVLSIEMHEMPVDIPFDPGSTAVSLLASPVPGFLWSGKPPPTDVRLYTDLFPQQADVTPAGTSPSLLGGFYFDSGLIGVIIGTVLVGFVIRRVWEYASPRLENPIVQIGYAVLLPLLLILMRGNPTDLFGRATFTVFPVLVFGWWSRRRFGGDPMVPSHSLAAAGGDIARLRLKGGSRSSAALREETPAVVAGARRALGGQTTIAGDQRARGEQTTNGSVGTIALQRPGREEGKPPGREEGKPTSATSRMHVLSVIHYATYGGPHHRNASVIPALREVGIETTVLLPDEPGNAFERLSQEGVPTIRSQLGRVRAVKDPLTHARFLRQLRDDVGGLRQLIRGLNIDVVLVNGLSNPHGAIAARLEGVPVVWQLLDTFSPMAMRRALMPIVTNLADSVMSTGLAVAEVHPGAISFGDRLVTFFPVVDVERFRNAPAARREARRRLGVRHDSVIVGNVGNLSPMKGHDLFIDAAAELAEQRPEIVFVILGAATGHHSEHVRRLWKRASDRGLKLGENLVMIDPADEVHRLAVAFDIFWLTSKPRSEGIPTVVGEAMALELPVIATQVGSVSEVVSDGVTGRLVSPESASGLVAATLQYVDDSGLRRETGLRGRERAKLLYSREACAVAHERAFLMAIAHHASRGGGRRR